MAIPKNFDQEQGTFSFKSFTASSLTKKTGLYTQLVKIDQLAMRYSWKQSDWDSFMSSRQDQVLVTLLLEKRAGKVAAFALFLTDSYQRQSHLLKITVNPDFQGVGLGRALLRKSIKNLESLGQQEIYLEVAESNSRAIDCYVANNFECIGMRSNFYSDGESAQIFSLKF